MSYLKRRFQLARAVLTVGEVMFSGTTGIKVYKETLRFHFVAALELGFLFLKSKITIKVFRFDRKKWQER